MIIHVPSSQPSTDPSVHLYTSSSSFTCRYNTIRIPLDVSWCMLVCNPSSCRFSNHKSSIFILVYCTYNPWQWKIQTFIGKYECTMEVNRIFASTRFNFLDFPKIFQPAISWAGRNQHFINILLFNNGGPHWG